MPAPLRIKVDEPPTRGASGYREVEVTRGRFRATHRTHTPARIVLTIFATFWNGVIGAALVSDWRGFLEAGFTLLHLGVGLVLLWYVLGAWLNSSVITIKDGLLSHSTGPIPTLRAFRKAPAVPLELVERFSVEKREWGKVNERPVFRFFVVAKIKSGESVTVTDGLPTRDAAEFLQQRFERHSKTTQSFD